MKKKKFISYLDMNTKGEIYTKNSIQLPKDKIPVTYCGVEIGKATLKFDEKSGMLIAEGTIDEEQYVCL